MPRETSLRLALVGTLTAGLGCPCPQEVSLSDGDWRVTSVSEGMPATVVDEVGTLEDGSFRIEYADADAQWAIVMAFDGSPFQVDEGQRGCEPSDGAATFQRVERLSGSGDIAAVEAQWERLTILRPNVITAEWGGVTQLTLRGDNELVALDAE